MTTQTIAEQQKTFVIKIDKNIEHTIDSATRSRLVDAYMKLFSGFAWVNWTKKQSLGRAWQGALGQCESFLKTKNKSNVAAKYLDKVSKAHKTYWSRVIMTNENSPNTINKTPEETKRLQQYGYKQIREAMDTINLILARYNEYVEEMSVTNTKTVEQHLSSKPQKQAVALKQPQQVAQPQAAETQKPMQQQITPAQPVIQPQPVIQNQPVKAIEAQPLPQKVATKEIAPTKQVQQIAKPQPQVTALKQPQPVTQNQPVKMVEAQPLPQKAATKEIAPAKQVQQIVKPQPQVTALKQPQQITQLNSASAQHVVKQRINLFIMAKYNQKAA